MKKTLLSKLKRAGLAAVSAYVIAGCPSSSATGQQVSAANDLAEPVPVATEVSQAAQSVLAQDAGRDLEGGQVQYAVCAALDDWQRPSESDQVKQLKGDPRFANAVEADALKADSRVFWDHQAISFTTYGLSARMEPMTLSGLWSAGDAIWDCYAPESTLAINQGEQAEAWLFNQRVVDMTWEEDRYVMSVEPAATGMQVIQFDRQEQLSALPLEIVSTSGDVVSVVSGDWQL